MQHPPQSARRARQHQASVVRGSWQPVRKQARDHLWKEDDERHDARERLAARPLRVTQLNATATFSACFMASTRPRGLIQRFDGRARGLGGRRERLVARRGVPMQRTAERPEFFDARIDILDAPGQEVAA